MRNHSKGLRQFPLRKGIGRKSLMEETERDFKIIFGEVFVKLFDMCRHHQSLVGDNRSGEGGNVKITLLFEFKFDLFAGEVNQRIEAPGSHKGIGCHKYLCDDRETCNSLLAQCFDIHRHFTTIEYSEVIVFTYLFDHIKILAILIEYHCHGIHLRQNDTLFLCCFGEEFSGN